MKEYFQGWYYRNHIALIAFHERSIRLIEFKKQRHGIKCIKILERNWDAGMSQNEQHEIEILKCAAAEFKLSRLKTIIQLPQNNLRHHLLKLPAGFNGKISDWLNQNSTQILPAGVKKNQIVYGYNHIQDAESSGFVLLTIAKLDAIKTWIDISTKLHLRIAGLNGNLLPLLSGFAFLDSAYFQENWAFLHFESKSVLLMITLKGNLHHYKEFFHACHDVESKNQRNVEVPGENKEKSWLDIVEAEIKEFRRNNALHKIIITGDKTDPKCNYHLNKIAEVKSGGELIKGILQVENADQFVPLFGLGVQFLFGQFETSDLRPEVFQKEIDDKEQQIQTFHFAGYLSLTLLCLLLIIMAANFLVQQELRNWQQEVIKLDNKISQIEELKNTGKQLSSQLTMHRDLINQRSQFANVLYDISKIMPEGVWLRSIRYGQTGDSEAVNYKQTDFPIVIEGLALAEAGPTKLLSEMEKLLYFDHVLLDLMQKIPSEVVFKKTKRHRIPLLKFKLSAWKKISG